mgnify:CR=1 FL=1
MSDEAIDPEAYRERLLALRAELQASARAGNADANTVELDQQRQGRLSRMDALGAQAMTLAAQRRRRETLQRCEAALRRIDSGDFGLCVRCEEEIDPRRLEFDPTVLLCIDCASRAER